MTSCAVVSSLPLATALCRRDLRLFIPRSVSRAAGNTTRMARSEGVPLALRPVGFAFSMLPIFLQNQCQARETKVYGAGQRGKTIGEFERDVHRAFPA